MTFLSQKIVLLVLITVIGFDYTGKQKDVKGSTVHFGVLVLTNII